MQLLIELNFVQVVESNVRLQKCLYAMMSTVAR